MRITILNQYYPPDLSPTGRLAASLAEHRAAQGDEVTVVTSAARYTAGRTEPAADAANVAVQRVRAPRGHADGLLSRGRHYLSFFAGAAWRLARLPRQDVVVSLTTPPCAPWLAVLHRRLHRRGGTRIVLWNMDCYPEILEVAGLIRPGGISARACRRLNRWLMRRIDHVVCLDEAMAELLKSRYAPESAPPAVTVIPNWERPLLDGTPAPWPGWRRPELEGRLIVLYLGNAGWGHEFDTVIEVADALRADPVAFVFIGGGRHHETIRRAAEARALPNVHLFPYVPEQDLPGVLGGADLGLITLSEQAAGVMSPSKLYSYLAAGVPVLYVGPARSNVDGAIARFGCGLRVAPGAVAPLAGFIRAALDDRRALLARRRAARRAFRSAYCAERTLPMFDAVLDGSAPAAAAESRLAA